MTIPVTCPDCGLEFEEETYMNAEDCAEEVLRYYTGKKPSVGDVQKLTDRIKESLVKDIGLSVGQL